MVIGKKSRRSPQKIARKRQKGLIKKFFQKPHEKERKKKARDVLHFLWFSKKDHIHTENFPIKNFSSEEFENYQKMLDEKIKKLESENEKKSGDLAESLRILKDIIIELRKENEELRTERQFFLSKIKTGIREDEKQIQNTYFQEEEQVVAKDAPKAEVKKENPADESNLSERPNERKIETSLDALLSIIIKKGAIKISDAAKQLHVKENQIEEWAHILEEHDMIEIHYPTMGKPVLKKR
jgi:hypothetical protein